MYLTLWHVCILKWNCMTCTLHMYTGHYLCGQYDAYCNYSCQPRLYHWQYESGPYWRIQQWVRQWGNQSGKRGRVTCISDPQMTLGYLRNNRRVPTPMYDAVASRSSIIQYARFPSNIMFNVPVSQAIGIIDLYFVYPISTQPYYPFLRSISLVDSIHPESTFSTLINEGILANTISKTLYQWICHLTSS